jgi:hypothetical protein
MLMTQYNSVRLSSRAESRDDSEGICVIGSGVEGNVTLSGVEGNVTLSGVEGNVTLSGVEG